MPLFEEIVEMFKELGSALLDCELILTTIGAALLVAVGAAVSYSLGVIGATIVPTTPTPTALPSFHCLMQLARCFP